MLSKTKKIVGVLSTVSKVCYIGSMVILGLVLVTFIASLIWPDANMNFKGIIIYDSALRQSNLATYLIISSITLIWAFLNVKIWQNANEVLSQVDIKSPFTNEIALSLEKIGHFFLLIWLLRFISNIVIDFFAMNITSVDKGFNMDFSLLFCAGIVYIISQVFKRGVEMQQENALTI